MCVCEPCVRGAGQVFDGLQGGELSDVLANDTVLVPFALSSF